MGRQMGQCRTEEVTALARESLEVQKGLMTNPSLMSGAKNVGVEGTVSVQYCTLLRKIESSLLDAILYCTE